MHSPERGTRQQAYLELGLHLSFAGTVTFTNKSLDALRDVAARVPLGPASGGNRQPLSQPPPLPRTNQRAGPRRPDGHAAGRDPWPLTRRFRPDHHDQRPQLISPPRRHDSSWPGPIDSTREIRATL